MPKRKAISDEEIVAAIIASKTIKEAAETVSLTPRAVYERMQSKSFRAAYSEARTDILRRAVLSVTEKMTAAVDTISEIMENGDVNPAVRLQAAQSILSTATKLSANLGSAEQKDKNLRDPMYFDFE